MRRFGVIAVVFFAGLLWAPAFASANPVVRFNTTLGNIDVELFADTAPNTVQNFLNYVNSGEYNGTVVQRSVPGFVIQGGGYTFANGVFSPIATQPPIQSEFNSTTPVKNLRGTIAMALTSGTNGSANTNSATDQWFFNLADNPNLDTQQFTVFGKVVDQASLNVMDSIAAEPIDTTHTSPNSAVPELSLSAGLTASNLIFVNSITMLNYPPPTITLTKPNNNAQYGINSGVTPVFSCADVGGPGLASCTAPKTVDTSLYGTFQYTVTATDNAGDTATKSVTYEVIPYSIPKPGAKSKPPALSAPLTVTKGGEVSIGLLCNAKVRCTGKLTVLTGKKHKKLIGAHRYAVNPQHTFTLTFRLNRRGRSLARHAHKSLLVTIGLKPTGKHTHTKTHRIHLKVVRP